jgi:uncharacterized protein (DUF433 family)
MEKTSMNLNEYFDFLDIDDIRMKGSRVGIETILEDYLNAASPEEIAVRYPTVTLEQVYATIAYYFRNKRSVDQYLERWRNYVEQSWQNQQHNPSPAIERLREIKRQRQIQRKEVMREAVIT